MSKNVVPNEEGIPQLDANDINILYTLVQSVSIKVSDAPAVSPVLDKCRIILETVNKKVNG
tara:strand:+ start:877 stop:1059 length:183 start_codon:yes stop_codon:yes gene_type:complete